MNLAEVRRIVGGVKATLFRNSNSYSIGMLKSHFKGTGLQFKEHQVYTLGDEVRFIDWKMFAKFGHPFVKIFEEERNVEIAVLIDLSPTMMAGYEEKSKFLAAIEIACLIYLLAKETGDVVHLILMGDKPLMVPRSSGDVGITRLIAALKDSGLLDQNGKIDRDFFFKNPPQNETKRLDILKKYLKRRREVVVLSDFRSGLPMKDVVELGIGKHVHCFRLLAPIDETEKTPYEILSFNQSLGGKKTSSTARSIVSEAISNRSLKVKDLRVQKRYLEDFVKEMM
jgi:uncharacterized protein (DUF58 family)